MEQIFLCHRKGRRGEISMAQIQVTDLTFSYDGSADDVLQNVSFSIDTNWKLGLIGRNGKGKTTLLQLFMGKYDYRGSITTGTCFDYFPYPVSEAELKQCAVDLLEKWKPRIELWQALIQMSELQMDRERAGVMLAVLFAAENEFLLVDEPTNHLDSSARDIVKAYLASKKGFILVSHDRDLLDHVCDHVLVLNRSSIEVQTGNFSSWWENKEKKDAFRLAENEKHLKEISKLKAAADRNSRWADQNENSKIGFDPVREHDRSISSRSFIGAKTKKMQARVKSYEQRIDREIEEKEGLLAASLITPAHLYIWDEPLNYIDVLSRMQIEKLIRQYEPTMLLVEHDVRFQEKVGTDVIKIQ